MATSRVNVKIPTQRLIDALGKSKEKYEKKIEEADALKEHAEKNESDREAAAVAYALDPKNSDAVRVGGVSDYSGKKKQVVTLYVDVPESALPKQVEFNGYTHREQVREYRDAISAIENNIRILNLTDDEFVSTSTYNSVARYL